MAEQDNYGMVKCELCGSRMKTSKLTEHMKNVHPKGVTTHEERAKIQHRRAAGKNMAMYAVLVAIIVLVAAMVVIIDPFKEETEMEYAPDWTLVDIGGVQRSLYRNYLDISDKPVFLEFYMTNCGHCHSLAQKMAVLHDTYGNNITFLSITIDTRDTISAVNNFISSSGADWTHFIDTPSENVAAKYEAHFTPHSFLIASDGKIVWTHLGDDSAAVFEEQFIKILDD